MERYRNQPSLVFWSMNFNLLGYPWDLNPYAWASDYRPPDAILDLGRKRRQAGESEAMVRAIDDSRIVFHHAGGNFGSMITSNFYISWPPLQERMDYPEPWSKTGVRPFNAVELGYPNPMDYSRCRDGSWQTMSGAEPMEAEYSAPYLGRRAYQLQEDRYLAIIDSNATGKQYSNCDFYEVKQPYLWDYNLREHERVQAVEQDHPVGARQFVDDSGEVADFDQPEKNDAFPDRVFDFHRLPDRHRPARAETDHHNRFENMHGTLFALCGCKSG